MGGGEDVLRMKNGELSPVQWKRYMSSIQAYQGEILDKEDVNKKFDEKLRLAERNQFKLVEQAWTGTQHVLIREERAPRGQWS
jgi:hypothetical protein